MTVATTAWFDLVNALIAKFRADPTIATTYGTYVNDGPIPTDPSQSNIIFVGARPSGTDAGNQSGAFSQTWGELGGRARYEDVTVACELVVRGGSEDLSVRRADAQAILAAVESALRIDFTLSIGRLLWCHVTSGEVSQELTPTTATVMISFTVAGRARLASQ